MMVELKWIMGAILLLVVGPLLVPVPGLFSVREDNDDVVREVADCEVLDHGRYLDVITIPETPRGADESGVDAITEVDRLLTEFDISNDIKFLESAQSLYPGNLDVVIISALNAKSEDSIWLGKLEAVQPGNALPHVMRASFHAEKSDMTRFAEEMREAVSKPVFDTRSRERLARILDELLDSGRFPDGVFSDGTLGNLDIAFIKRHGHVLDALVNNENIFGDADETTSIGFAWAKRWQSMSGLGLTYQYFGGYLESEILGRYQAGDAYGTDGMTVGDRREELTKLGNSLNRKLQKYNDLILANHSSSNLDRILKRQFFSRLRAGGEVAAVNWLMSQ